MGTLTINGRKVTVDDGFANLTAEQQEATVNEIAAQMGSQPGAVSGSAAAEPPKPTKYPVPFQDQIAFADQAIESVPVAGPWLKEQAQNLRGLIAPLFGTTKEQADQYSQQSVENAPVASVAGQAFGTVAPLAVAGTTALGGRLLGATGGLASRIGFGGVTGAALSGADTLARGGDVKQATESGILGAGIGAGVPLVGAGLSRLLGGSVSREARNIGRALKDDGVDPASINQQLQTMGPDAMVMDLGPNLQAQAGALASVPGQAQKTLRAAVQARAKDASKRVGDDLAATVGTGPEIGQMTEQIVAAQKAAADPLYAAIRDVPVNVTGNLRLVLQTPMGKAALAEAKRLAANDGVPGAMELAPEVEGMTAGMADYLKRALDDAASTAARSGAGNVARQAGTLAKLVVREVDAQVPGYAKARAAFAGPAQVLDAIEIGQTVLGKDMSPGQLQSMLSGMSGSEKAAMLQSFRASLEAQLGNAVNDALSLRNLFKKGWNETKLRMLLGDDIADDLIKRIDREAAFGRTNNAVSGNSETARRMAAQEEIAPDHQRIEPASVAALVFRQINKALARIQGNVHGKSNAKLAEALASGNLSPKVLAQAKRAMAPKGRLPLPPAGVPLIPAPDNRRWTDITVYGGAK